MSNATIYVQTSKRLDAPTHKLLAARFAIAGRCDGAVASVRDMHSCFELTPWDAIHCKPSRIEGAYIGIHTAMVERKKHKVISDMDVCFQMVVEGLDNNERVQPVLKASLNYIVSDVLGLHRHAIAIHFA